MDPDNPHYEITTDRVTMGPVGNDMGYVDNEVRNPLFGSGETQRWQQMSAWILLTGLTLVVLGLVLAH